MLRGTRRDPVKAKKVKIGIRSVESAMDDFVKTTEAIRRGEKVKKESGVYFTSIEAFRRALTPQRLGLLRLIRESAPASLHELARLAHRNIKNVSDDVRYLSQVGLVDLREAEKKVSARVNYDKILLEIAV
jgi:predicted transcriptional regulator